MKKHPPFTTSFRSGFTLIELLVVIVIIAILASLALPVGNMVTRRANELKIKTTMKDIQVAIGYYRTEYNRFPIDQGDAGDGETDMEPFLTDGTEQPTINILMANVDTSGGSNLNPRKIKFLDLPFARNNMFGIIDPSGGSGEGTPVQLVDMWGLPYKIALDTNYDNRLKNPDKTNDDPTISSQAPENLNATAIVYSFGPDKAEFTKDDITSWR